MYCTNSTDPWFGITVISNSNSTEQSKIQGVTARVISKSDQEHDYPLGWVVRKAVNANPGLKVNRGHNFSYMKMYSTADVLCSLTLLKLKTEGQTI